MKAGWHHRLDAHESEWTPGVVDGQGGLACCSSWGRKESDTTERLNWTELSWWLMQEGSDLICGCKDKEERRPLPGIISRPQQHGLKQGLMRKAIGKKVLPRFGIVLFCLKHCNFLSYYQAFNIVHGPANYSPWASHVCKVFIWSQECLFIYISSLTVFILQLENEVVTTEIVWPTTPKILIIWSQQEFVPTKGVMDSS